MEDLEAHEMAAFVEVDVDVWGNLFGFRKRRVIRSEASVEGVGILIGCELQGFLAPRSKKAVSTTMSVPSGRWASPRTRLCA